MTQRDRAKSLPVEIVCIGAKAARGMFKTLLPACSSRIQFGQSAVGRPAPRSVPGGLVERGIGLVEAALIAQDYTELIVCLAIVGVRIASRQPSNRSMQVRFGLCKLATLKVPRAKRSVAAGVAGIAANSFPPVRLRAACRMAVLLQVKTNQVQLIVARDLFW